jgi:hypothetical protein
MSVSEKEKTVASQPAGDATANPTLSQALAAMVRAYEGEYIFTLTGAPQDALIEMQNREKVQVVLGHS